jgi:hypothetical protein
MECNINECIECNSFKVPIEIKKIIRKIAEMSGFSRVKVRKVDEGVYLLIDETTSTARIKIKCEREDFSWSDYCIRCYLLL